MLKNFNWKKTGLFVGGVLFGTVGIKALSSKDAKKCYTHFAAAVLRVKDFVLRKTEILKENCEDIYEDAKIINDERYEEDFMVYEDVSDFKEVDDEEL